MDSKTLRDMVDEWAERSRNHQPHGSVIIHEKEWNDFLNKFEKQIRESIAQKITAKHLSCWSFTDCTHLEDETIALGKGK